MAPFPKVYTNGVALNGVNLDGGATFRYTGTLEVGEPVQAVATANEVVRAPAGPVFGITEQVEESDLTATVYRDKKYRILKTAAALPIGVQTLQGDGTGQLVAGGVTEFHVNAVFVENGQNYAEAAML